ncbi:MAG: hypothetical protein SGILL_006014 [Bacillariaceae sp.]
MPCIDAYSTASSKSVKSEIVSDIYAEIVNKCPQGQAFVKWDGENFWPVMENQARDKIAGRLRDVLHDKYRSSSKAKVAKRRQARNHRRQQKTKAHEQIISKWEEPLSPTSVRAPELTLSNAALAPPSFERVRTFSIPSMDALLMDTPSRRSLVNLMTGPLDFDFSHFIQSEAHPTHRCSNSTIVGASDEDHEDSCSSSSSLASSCIFDEQCNGDCDLIAL